MTTNIQFQQAEEKVDQLLLQKNFSEALQICNDLLESHPYSKYLERLKKKIQKEVDKHNDNYIKEQYLEGKQLLKEGNYQQSIKVLMNALRYAPHNQKVKSTFLKAQKKYKNYIKNLQANFIKDNTKRLEELMHTDQNKFITELFELEKKNPGNRIVLALTKSFRDKLIKEQIEKNHELIFSRKFDIITNFIQKLKKIDEKNPRVLQLEESIKKRLYGSQIEQRGEFVYRGEQHLQTLMKLKKYEKAITVATEILATDKNNKVASKTLKKARKKFFQLTRNQTVDLIEKKQKSLEAEYQKDPKSFLKI